MPQRLADRFLEALRDPDLISLHSDVATVDARLAELLERLHKSGEGSRTWRELRAARRDLVASRDRDDKSEAAAALTRLLVLIDRGASEESLWDDIAQVIDQRRRLVTAEAARLRDQRNSLSLDSVAALMVSLANVICAEVTDLNVRRSILRHVTDLSAGGLLVLPGGLNTIDPNPDDAEQANDAV